MQTEDRSPYGPVKPPDLADVPAQLDELLREGGLKPIEVRQPADIRGVTLLISPLDSKPYTAVALHSTNTESDGLMIRSIVSHEKVVLREADPSSFNLSHVIPIDLGDYFSKTNPLRLMFSLRDNVSARPELKLTIWCREYVPEPVSEPAAPKRTIFTPKDRLLFKTLKALRATDQPVDDPEIRSLLDEYADVL